MEFFCDEDLTLQNKSRGTYAYERRNSSEVYKTYYIHVTGTRYVQYMPYLYKATEIYWKNSTLTNSTLTSKLIRFKFFLERNGYKYATTVNSFICRPINGSAKTCIVILKLFYEQVKTPHRHLLLNYSDYSKYNV